MKQNYVANTEDTGELDLVSRAAQGDGEAFHQLVLFYEPRLIAYLTRMLGDAENAHDLTQETFVAAYRALPRWRPPQQLHEYKQEASGEQRYLHLHPLAPWLYRIASNLALNFLKRQASSPLHVSYTVPGQFSASSPLTELELPELVAQASAMPLEERYALRELLREALNQLSREDATCLLLRFVEGERYADIAARLGLSKEAVRKRVGRGLAALRTIYLQLDNGGRL